MLKTRGSLARTRSRGSVVSIRFDMIRIAKEKPSTPSIRVECRRTDGPFAVSPNCSHPFRLVTVDGDVVQLSL